MKTETITLRKLKSNGLIQQGRYIIPKQFIEQKWAAVLPMSCILAFPHICYSIAKQFTIDETIAYLDGKKDAGTFLQLSNPLPCYHEMTDGSDELSFRDREIKIAALLRTNGYPYPKNVSEMIELYISLGILICCRQGEETMLDLVIQPFPELRKKFTL